LDEDFNSVMARAYTVDGFRIKLQGIADRNRLGRAVMRPLRKGQRKIALELIRHYWKHKLARIIWEWRKGLGTHTSARSGATFVMVQKSGPMVFTKKRHRTRWSHSQKAYIAPIHVEGLAALVEAGGYLEKHVIFGRAERRPGLMVRRSPAISRITEREWPGIVRDAEDSFAKFVDRIL
jgi:hypothetical protein